jgi:elongation factor Ts
MSSELTNKIKELREKTNAGFLDCQKALKTNDMDIDKAAEYLREKGIASFEKRSGNTTGSGDFGVYQNESRFCIVPLLTETDFVANTQQFMDLANNIAQELINRDEAELSKTLFEIIDSSMHSQVLSLKENVQLGPVFWLDLTKGPVYYYIHRGGSNRFAGVVQLDKPLDKGRDIAVHIACAMPEPIALEASAVPEKEVTEFIQNAEIDGEKVTEKSARERLSLLDAKSLKEPDVTIKQLLGDVKIIYWRKLRV